MFKLSAILALTVVCCSAAPGAVLAPYASPLVTAHSSQVVARNHNGLAAPLVAAPVAAVAAPLAAPVAAPLVAGPVVKSAPYIASPYAPYVAAPYAPYVASPYLANPYLAAGAYYL